MPPALLTHRRKLEPPTHNAPGAQRGPQSRASLPGRKPFHRAHLGPHTSELLCSSESSEFINHLLCGSHCSGTRSQLEYRAGGGPSSPVATTVAEKLGKDWAPSAAGLQGGSGAREGSELRRPRGQEGGPGRARRRPAPRKLRPPPFRPRRPPGRPSPSPLQRVARPASPPRFSRPRCP